MDTTQLVAKIEEVANSNISAFELGKWLHELDIQLGISTNPVLKAANAKGRGWTKLRFFMRLYRVYRDFPPEKMNRLSDPIALALSESIISGKVHAKDIITDNRCNMPRAEALGLALSDISPENLKLRVRANDKHTPAFKDEKAIEEWFASIRTDFAQERQIQFVVSQAAFGDALGDVDHVFFREIGGLSTVVLLDLKDSVNYQDIGQVLGQKNELIEKSTVGANKGKDRIAFFYPAYKNLPSKFSESHATEIAFNDVDTWLVGQIFHPSAYYAAKGQDIYLFRISSDKRIEGPIHTRNITWSQWLEFTHDQPESSIKAS